MDVKLSHRGHQSSTTFANVEFNETVNVIIEGEQINVSFWRRLKLAWKLIWRPNSTIANVSVFIAACDFRVPDGKPALSVQNSGISAVNVAQNKIHESRV